MMVVSWLIIFMLGLGILNAFAKDVNLLEKLGFSMPIGLGIATMFMFLFDGFGLPMGNQNLLLGTSAVVAAIFHGMAFKFYREQANQFAPKEIFDLKKIWPINFGWLVLMACIGTVVYAIVSKTLFWPVFIHDSVNGYDFLARVILAESTFNNSIFDPSYPLYSPRTLYPPLTPLSFSISYMFGHDSAKVITAIFYVSNTLVFYSMLKRYSSHLAAALFSLLFIVTPEFAAFSALSSPNPMCTFYCAMGLLSLYVWYKDNIGSYFVVGFLCIMLALWTRTEAIVFFAAGGLLVLIRFIKEKTFLKLALYSISGVILFVFWRYYLANVLLVENPDNIIKHLYWDGEKLGRMLAKVKAVTFNMQFYGVLVYLFLGMLVLNAYFHVKYREGFALLSVIILPWLAYMFIYYQLDTPYTNDGSVWIESGYKRGLFYFFPLVLFYCANNRIADTIFNKWLKL